MSDRIESAAVIAEALACGQHGCQCAATARRGSGLTHCPAHSDIHPSLSVSEKDGKPLFHCQAGCSQEAVITVLRERGLWGEAKVAPSPHSQPPTKRIVATFPYEDEAGCPLFEAVRYEPKDFRLRCPNGNGGFVYNLDGVRRVLYRLPQLVAADPAEPVYIVEGEKHADRLAAMGFVSTTSPMGAGKWRREYADTLTGRKVVVLPDNDGPGRSHAQEVAASLHGVAAEVRILELPDVPEKGDVLDWLDAGGTAEALRTLADAAPTWEPEPVPDGAALLDDVAVYIRRFVVLTPQQADAVALWIMHTHCVAIAEATPYLSITSPEKRSGKTRLLEVLELLAARPWFTGRATPAVLVRKIDRDAPTLLLDESDAAFKGSQEYAEALRGVLNTGHRRGGVASLCVKAGGDFDLKDFATFCPKAIAGIGKLPDTVADRAITISLKRRAPTEPIERFRRTIADAEAKPLRARLTAWAAGNLDALRDARPEIPNALDDRAVDGWEPLICIADLVGGEWPSRSRRTALGVSAGDGREDESSGVQLLGDIRDIFQERETDRLSSADILVALNGDEERPWGDLQGKPLDPRRLAKLLRPFGIRVKPLRIGSTTLQGYLLEAFSDAFGRYLSVYPLEPQQAQQAQQAPDSDSASVVDVVDVGARTDAQERASPLVQAALEMGATLIDSADAALPSSVTCMNREGM